GKDASLRECVLCQPAGAQQHRLQCLTLFDGVLAGKLHLPDQCDLFSFGPSLDPLDAETVEGLEPQVGGRISAQYRRQVNLDELDSTRLAINDPVARELGAAAVRRIAQAATGSDEVPHRHADLERIRSGYVGTSVDTHHLV